MPEAEFGDFQQLIAKLNMNPFCFVYRGFAEGTPLDKRQEIFLVRARDPKPDECSVDKITLFSNLKRIKIKFAYESIYKDKFTYTYNPS